MVTAQPNDQIRRRRKILISAPPVEVTPCVGEQAFKRAVRPAESSPIAEWAEKHFILDARTNARPGPIDLSLTPYLRGILDAFQHWAVRQITFVACTQVGKTTAELICLGWTIDQKPVTTMMIMPTEMLARRFSITRIKPLFSASPALDAHRPNEAWSEKITEYHLDRMSLLMGWANSPAVLSSTPAGAMLLDEVDKYPIESGKEADADDLAEERIKTYDDSKVFRASSPTDPQGPITISFLESNRSHFYVPCPHCEHEQRLIWSQVRWPDGVSASRIKAGELAYYECIQCQGRIEDHQKLQMMRIGRWIADNPEVAEHAGFHLNTLYSPFVTFSDVVAKFLKAKGIPRKLKNFTNSWLGEPWEDRVTSVDEQSLERLRTGLPRGIVPEECQILTIGVDVHTETKGLYWSCWAFAAGRRRWLVDYGILHSWSGVEALIFDRDWSTPTGILFNPFVGIDSNYETPKVYDFTRRLWPQVMPIRGHEALRGRTIRETPIDYTDQLTGRRYVGFQLLNIDTNFYKDLLAAGLMPVKDDQPTVGLCSDVGDEFLRSMASEHKVHRKGKRGPVWVKRSSGASAHWWDTSNIASAVAEKHGWSRLRPLELQTAAPAKKAAQEQPLESPLARHLAGRRH